jgi:hypothetical protein
MSKIPTIIKNILLETYLDFENVDVGDDVSKTNLKNLLQQIKDGKDDLNILESSVLFEFFYKGYDSFRKSKPLDSDRLQSDTLNYYEELHKQYYDDIDFQSLDRNNPTTFTIMMDSIHCENFILIDYVKRNFNIIYFEDEMVS